MMNSDLYDKNPLICTVNDIYPAFSGGNRYDFTLGSRGLTTIPTSARNKIYTLLRKKDWWFAFKVYTNEWQIYFRPLRPYLQYQRLSDYFYRVHLSEVQITFFELYWWTLITRNHKFLRLAHVIGELSIPLLQDITKSWSVPHDISYHCQLILKEYDIEIDIFEEISIRTKNFAFNSPTFRQNVIDTSYVEFEKNWIDDDWTKETSNQILHRNYLYIFDYDVKGKFHKTEIEQKSDR